MMKKIAVILNGISLEQKVFYSRILPGIKSIGKTDVFETRSKEHAIDLAAKAVYQGYEGILAAGGDGTLNEVINGVLRGNEQSKNLPAVGLIPLGSANDYAKTLKLSAGADDIIGTIRNFRLKPVDIGKIIFTKETRIPPRYFINIADVGMGPSVVKRMQDSDRAFGTHLSYYFAIINNFFTYRLLPVEVTTLEWTWQGPCRVVAVAKGKYFGSGLGIAPDAIPDNREFAVTLVGKVTLLDFLLQQGRLRKGTYAKHKNIAYKKATSVEMRPLQQDMWIEADGELVGKLPVRIELLPLQLNFIVS